PGTSRAAITLVASGVTSRCDSPVPPVVRIKSFSPLFTKRSSSPPIWVASSGTRCLPATFHPSSVTRASRAGPDWSTRVPAKVESLTVTTATLMLASIRTPEIPALAAGLFEQIHVLNLDAFVECLGHVVYRERGYRHRGQRL